MNVSIKISHCRDRVSLIKRVRDHTGLSLLDSKKLVDRLVLGEVMELPSAILADLDELGAGYEAPKPQEPPVVGQIYPQGGVS